MGSSQTRTWTLSPALAGGFITTAPPGKSLEGEVLSTGPPGKSLKSTVNTTDSLTHDRFKYLLQSTYWWIIKWITTDFSLLHFYKLCKFVHLSLFFLPPLVAHFSNYFRLYRISIFSTSFKIFWPVIACRLFIEINSFFFFLNYLFIYFWLCWVFVSVRGLSPVAASEGHSPSRCAGLSLSWPLLLRSTGSRRAGSAVVAHGPSCSAACGIPPDQGSNPCPPHRQADSQPLRHQGSPRLILYSLQI